LFRGKLNETMPRLAPRAWIAASAVVLAALVAQPSPLAAQTTDPIFAGYRWAPGELGSRPAGLAGAFAGLADGAKAAVANPAGLTLIPISEVDISSGRPWAAAALGHQRFRVAAYFTQADEASTDLPATSPTTGGFRDSSVWEAGLAAGMRLHARVRLGASLAWSRLALDAERSEATVEGEETVAASIHASSGQLRGSLGLLAILLGGDARAMPSLRMGVSIQPGFDWSVPVVSASGAQATVDLHRPTVISAGFALRASDRWTVLAQGDVVRYGEVMDTLVRNVGADQARGFSLTNVLEPRVAAEFSAPLWCGCGSVKVRGGLHYRSPGTLVYDGTDPALTLAFAAGTWRTVGTLGASLYGEYYGNGFRFDIDSRDLVHGPDLSFGIVWRF
jgi:hypothetical protein